MTDKLKSLEELRTELARVERERDAKGRGHQDYKLANILVASLEGEIRKMLDKNR